VQRAPVDVVLLDWELPGMPPAELVQALRAVRPSLPVVAMSARHEARAAALAAGVTAFCSKAAPPETVPATLRAAAATLRAAANGANWPVDQG
jgi:DNA-binding NarL/FixJ family response regulator